MAATWIISFFLLMTGTSMIIIWIMDIGKNPEVDLSEGFFKAREKNSQNLFWFHILAEITTGILLIASGIVLLLGDINLHPVVHFALGALFYASLNSLGWAFAEKGRRSYALPMLSGLIISIISIIILIA
jgi:hypothetical protein